MLLLASLFGLMVLLFLIGIAIAVWVYRDASKRYPKNSSMPAIWLLIVLLTGLIGLIIYIIVRPKEIEQERTAPIQPGPY